MLWCWNAVVGCVLVAAQPVADAAEIAAPAMIADEDLERLLAEADRRIEAGDWELAGKLVQRVLDEGRTALVRERTKRQVGESGWLAASLAAERRLARFSDEGLRRYRLQVDTDARTLLGGSIETASLATLSEVARRYFFTSLGRQAAWRLARVALERFDFTAASYYGERLKQPSDLPTPPRRELARVAAVAAAYVADEASVDAWLSELQAEEPAMNGAAAGEFQAAIRRTLGDESRRIEAAADDDLRRIPQGGDLLASQWLEQTAKADARANWQWRGVSPSPMEAAAERDEHELVAVSEPDRIAAVLRLTSEAAWTAGYDEITPLRDAVARGERWRRTGAWLSASRLATDARTANVASTATAEGAHGSSTGEWLGPRVSNRELEFVPLRRDGTLFVAAYRRADGAPLWETRAARASRDRNRTAPVVLAADEGQVYAAWGEGSYLALDARTGAVRWGWTPPHANDDGEAGTGNGAGQNRMTLSGRWAFSESTSEGWIWALDRRDGRRAWGIPTQAPEGVDVERVIGVRGELVIVAGRDGVRAHEAATGRLRWTARANPQLGAPLLLARHLLLVQTADRLNQTSPARLGIDWPKVAAWRCAELALLDLESGQVVVQTPLSTSLIPPWTISLADGELQLASDEARERLQLTKSEAAVVEDLVSRLSPLTPLEFAERPPHDANAAAAQELDTQPDAKWRLLVSDLTRGAVMELSPEGRVVWESAEARAPGPVCGVGTKRRWALDQATNRLVEWDEQGRKRGAWSGLPGRPASLSAGSDENVWLTFPTSGLVARVDRDGRWRDALQLAGRPVDAAPAADGVWVALADMRQAVHVDRQGAVQVAVNFADRPRWLQLLSEETPLATFPERFQVVKWNSNAGAYDEQVVRSGVRGFRGAWKLPDEGWIVVEANSFSCLDAAGRTRWKRDGVQTGGAAVVRYD